MFGVETRTGADLRHENERINVAIKTLLERNPDARLTEPPKLVAGDNSIMVMLTIDCSSADAPGIQKQLSVLLHSSE